MSQMLPHLTHALKYSETLPLHEVSRQYVATSSTLFTILKNIEKTWYTGNRGKLTQKRHCIEI
jgi:hypothetical protein